MENLYYYLKEDQQSAFMLLVVCGLFFGSVVIFVQKVFEGQ